MARSLPYSGPELAIFNRRPVAENQRTRESMRLSGTSSETARK